MIPPSSGNEGSCMSRNSATSDYCLDLLADVHKAWYTESIMAFGQICGYHHRETERVT